MNFNDFFRIDAIGRKSKSKIFDAVPPDKSPTLAQLRIVELAINMTLGNAYKEFLLKFGGGNYGLVVIFSGDSESEWYLPRNYNLMKRYIPEGYIPVSDDFSGGIYCQKNFSSEDERLYVWTTDGGVQSTEYVNVYDYISKNAY